MWQLKNRKLKEMRKKERKALVKYENKINDSEKKKKKDKERKQTNKKGCLSMRMKIKWIEVRGCEKKGRKRKLARM